MINKAHYVTTLNLLALINQKQESEREKKKIRLSKSKKNQEISLC